MSALVKPSKKPPAKVASAPVVDDNKQYLTFMLGGEMFSLSILAIKEIIWYANLTDVPMMPACIRGVINLRGAVVPVIDLHVRFGRTPARVTKKTCIVIFDAQRGSERVELGLLVDAVSEVIDIAGHDIETPPDFGTAVRRDFIRGMGRVGQRFVIVLDPDRAFDVDDMAQLCERSQLAEAA
jgi:purine-binding chemotaxis protein CheW